MALTPEEKKQRALEATKRWRERNPERVKELGRKYDANRNEGRADQRRTYREANKDTLKEKHKQWRERDGVKDHINKYQRAKRVERLYGIRQDDIPFIIAKQGGCAACNTKNPGSRGWAIDHCHNSNEYRGILCHPCNIALGLVGDSIDRLKQLIGYLERTSPT